MLYKKPIQNHGIQYICIMTCQIKKLLLFVFSLVALSSCENRQQETPSEQTVETTTEDDRISRKDIEAIRYDDYGLSPESQDAIIDWQKYDEMIIQTENLKKNDLTFFTNETTLIRTFLNDLRREIPKSVQSNEIYARLTVVQTTMLKLNSLLNLDNIKKEDKISAIKDYLVAVSNLNLLINNKFEFESNNIKKPD